jgi:hypothetical protein
LDHLEKTFADAYRKEVDQEENVWRSLPFFAATLALQVAALGTLRGWITGVGRPELVAAAALLAAAGGATLAAMVFLVLSVWPAEYLRLMSEPLLLAYASKVQAEDLAMAEPGTSRLAVAEGVLVKVKATLADQYSQAAENNRRINERRGRHRTRAGLAALVSVFIVLVLVALSMV